MPMIKFSLNGSEVSYDGDPKMALLNYLRETAGIVSAKNGCSGEATCGACLVEMNAKPALSCVTPMEKVKDASIVTIEGFPENLRRTLGRAFVSKGAVQCGFCTPGFLSRAKMYMHDTWHGTLRSDIAACLLLGPAYADYGFLQMENEESYRDYSVHEVLCGKRWWRARYWPSSRCSFSTTAFWHTRHLELR